MLCFSLAMWNGKDAILKERLFGLTNSEGNHGEDVKECYFYVDSAPTHSYMKYLSWYPQKVYPYEDLIDTNKRRSRNDPEYELIDTGAFDENRYFDVFIEYAKESSEDVLIKITAVNRGPDPASLQLLPTLWYRNTWSWSDHGAKPVIECARRAESNSCRISQESSSSWTRLQYYLHCDGAPDLLFTENETNNAKLFGVRTQSGTSKMASTTM